MKHDTTVSYVPGGSAGRLLPHKPIRKPQDVMRKRLVKVHVAVFLVERLVLIVRNPNHAVFDPKRVFVIVAYGMPGNFYVPASQIFAVEELRPLAFVGLGEGRKSNQTIQSKEEGKWLYHTWVGARSFGEKVPYAGLLLCPLG